MIKVKPTTINPQPVRKHQTPIAIWIVILDLFFKGDVYSLFFVVPDPKTDAFVSFFQFIFNKLRGFVGCRGIYFSWLFFDCDHIGVWFSGFQVTGLYMSDCNIAWRFWGSCEQMSQYWQRPYLPKHHLGDLGKKPRHKCSRKSVMRVKVSFSHSSRCSWE